MNFHKLKIGAVLAAALMTLGGAASAATVTVVTDSSTVLSTDALTGFSTDGADMAGMIVTANGTDSATWATTGSSSGRATGSAFRLSLSGDSFNTQWRLRVNAGQTISSLTLYGAPGNTVFDLTNGGANGTPGSFAGLTFDSSVSGNITATYSDAVALTGNSPVGDLFSTLTLDFSQLSGGGLSGGTILSRIYRFSQDTDNAATDLVPVDAVPLPAAGWMLLAGLGGLVAAKRRKKAA